MGYERRKPNSPARFVSHAYAVVNSNSTSSAWLPGVERSTARPVWCSLKPGGAHTVRISLMATPLSSFWRTISACRSMLRKAETMNNVIPSETAADLSLPHASAAAGTSKCSLPSVPISAHRSSVASSHACKPRADMDSTEIPSATRCAFMPDKTHNDRNQLTRQRSAGLIC